MSLFYIKEAVKLLFTFNERQYRIVNTYTSFRKCSVPVLAERPITIFLFLSHNFLEKLVVLTWYSVKMFGSITRSN